MMRAWQGAIGTSKALGMVSPAYIVARLTNEIDPVFLDYEFHLPRIIESINRRSYGVTDFRKRLYWDSFVKIKISIPNLKEEQIKIGSFFTELDASITLHQRKLDKHRNHVYSALKMFVNCEHFGFVGNYSIIKRFSVIICLVWEQRKLRDIVNLIERKIKIDDNEKYQLITIKRRNEGIVPRSELFGREILVKNYQKLFSGDYVISKRQVVHGANGIVPPKLNGSIASNEYQVIGDSVNLKADFLNLLSHTKNMYRQFYLSSYGVDIEKLFFDLEDWLKRVIYVPTIKEQECLIHFFGDLQSLITLHQRYRAPPS